MFIQLKKIAIKSIAYLPGLFILFSLTTAFYCALFTYRFAFNFDLDNNDQYFAAFTVITGWLLYLLFFSIHAFKSAISCYQFIMLLISNIFILLLSYSSCYSLANEYFTCIAIISLLFIIVLTAKLRVLHVIICGLSVAFLWQLYLAFDQMDKFECNITPLNIEGSLQNTGVYCCYLVSNLPFLYYVLFNFKTGILSKRKDSTTAWIQSASKAARILIFSACLGFSAFIIWRSESRTAIIAMATLLFFFLAMNNNIQVRKRFYKLPRPVVLSLAFVLLGGLGYAIHYLFHLKRLSASGRVMKLYIAGGHLSDNPLLGTGIGRFTWHYPQWQASYFASHPNPPQDFYFSASESFILFNEYMQIMETVGLTGFAGFIIIMILFFKTKSTRNQPLLNATKLTVIAILACGFTSYPFHVNILLLLIFFCFALAAVLDENFRTRLPYLYVLKTIRPLAGKIVLCLTLFIAALGSYNSFEQWKAKMQWDKLRNQGLADVEERKGYEQLYEAFKYNGKFLTEYGMFLMKDSASSQEAVTILEEAKRYVISSINMEALGRSYKKAGNYKMAIENYRWLSNYIPSRFTTKMELLKLYDQVKDTENAQKIARTILTMPVKIPSYEVVRIKKEAGNMLRKYETRGVN
ncbi:O-antigen ligase-like membrane protein [Chitinophaga polysaccharea]|uniref:O-antigen ligase-like membrane protein n=1 Tax=Chitinophaga polysaccharea TaxID=1293035 RepID=A0A561PQM0_9BACT|nr:O-antigen ligase family protein [Chitinophaga polysaccharea]TWF40410.1 O-antigen ligase-like membrane protein [Chitinophaga polysaccharea]